MGEVGKKIVIFDDDENIVAICTYILEEQGWTVASFTDCNNAAAKVLAEKPAVILMDNWIPDQGGILATRSIKSTAGICEIPVVYFSANADIGLLAKSAGADSHLAKPFDIEQLLDILAQSIKR